MRFGFENIDSQIANDLAQANTFTYNDDRGNHVVQVLSDKGNGLFSVNADGNVTDMGVEMLYEISSDNSESLLRR